MRRAERISYFLSASAAVPYCAPLMLTFFITLLTILEVIVCLLLTLLVLMQRPRQEGLGAAFGTGVTDQMFGAQTTNVLQKATVYLGAMLFGLTFVLAILVSKQNHNAKANASLVRPEDKAIKVDEKADGQTPDAEAAKKAMMDAVQKEIDKGVVPAPATTPAVPAAAKPADAKPEEKKPAPTPAAELEKKVDATPAPDPAPSTSTPTPAPVPTTPPVPPAPPK